MVVYFNFNVMLVIYHGQLFYSGLIYSVKKSSLVSPIGGVREKLNFYVSNK